MPVHKVKGGYKWGKTGKTYPTKKQAERQARAIYANGYKGVNENDNNENMEISKNMNRKNTIRLTESELKKVITESVKNILKEATVSENQLADRTYPLIGDLIDAWDNIRDNTGRYSETATRVVGALQNVLNVLRDISREHKENGMGGYDFSRFPRPDDGGWIE